MRQGKLWVRLKILTLYFYWHHETILNCRHENIKKEDC